MRENVLYAIGLLILSLGLAGVLAYFSMVKDQENAGKKEIYEKELKIYFSLLSGMVVLVFLFIFINQSG